MLMKIACLTKILLTWEGKVVKTKDITCKNRTISRVTCSEMGIRLLYRITKVSKLYPKFLLKTSGKGKSCC